MSRLEIIHLRSPGASFEAIASEISQSIPKHGRIREFVTVYRRCGLETDVSIHIRHSIAAETEIPEGLATHLAASLRALGLVEHTVWESLP